MNTQKEKAQNLPFLIIFYRFCFFFFFVTKFHTEMSWATVSLGHGIENLLLIGFSLTSYTCTEFVHCVITGLQYFLKVIAVRELKSSIQLFSFRLTKQYHLIVICIESCTFGVKLDCWGFYWFGLLRSVQFVHDLKIDQIVFSKLKLFKLFILLEAEKSYENKNLNSVL